MDVKNRSLHVARLQKLSTMSAREVTSRAGYEVLTAWERWRDGQPRADHLERLRSAVSRTRRSAPPLEWLLARRRERRATFLPGVENRAEMQALFRTRYASELDRSKKSAEQTCNHCFEFFGQRFEYESEIDWQADPETRRRWPNVYHRHVPIHDHTSPFGDVKYVWELSRHQFLVDLGKVCFLESNERHAAAAAALVRSWIAQNPRGIGVNWASPLEPAFRVLSWLWTYHLCLESTGLDDQTHLIWLSGFHDHAQFLYRHLELYSSPYNHLIGEAAALYALGVLFPEFREAAAWRRRGRHILESRLSQQFYRDGGSVEQSTFYHHATLGFYLFAALLGRANNEELADPIWQAIERAIEFSMYLIQPDGSTPPIGGADDGKPIRLGHRALWDFRTFQAVGAVLFNRADMKHLAGDFSEDALWLLGASGRTHYDAMFSASPQETCQALEASGYFVVRNRWTKDADYLCFDCGEQADSVRRDDIPNAVHGHADCLSVTVWLGGRAVLVDPGMYRYNGDPSWVSHFRRTGAHNTLTVDGRDQARYHGKMSWSNAFRAQVEDWHPAIGEAFVMGCHDGYARSADGVLHRRVAWMRPDGYVIVWDEVAGAGKHELQLRWQFATGKASLLGANSLLFDDFAETSWVASVETTRDFRVGGPHPSDGWIAGGLGVRHPAPVLTISAPFETHRAVFLTVLADRRVTGHAVRTAVVRNHDRGIAVMVRNPNSIDWIVSGDMGEKLPFVSDGKLAVWRVRDGCVVDAYSIGGRQLYPRAGDREIRVPDVSRSDVVIGACG